MKRKFSIVLLITIFSLLFTIGCSNGKENTNTPSEEAAFSFTYTIGSNDWSALAPFKPTTKTLEAYQFAAEHPEVLDYMPCYCGCYEDAGHINNTDCFIQSVQDNVAVLDNMGLG